MYKKQALAYLVSILLLTSIVLAVGTSTRSRDTNVAPIDTTTTATDSPDSQCDSKENRVDRIKCRLQESKENRVSDDIYQKTIPESCRRLKEFANPDEAEKVFTLQQCRAFYNAINRCYDEENPREKFSCFRNSAGLTNAALSGQAEHKRALRGYVVELLYELQGKIENAVNSTRITPEQAAPVIDKIVEIKEKIMNGASRDEVKPLLNELRTEINKLKEELQDE